MPKKVEETERKRKEEDEIFDYLHKVTEVVSFKDISKKKCEKCHQERVAASLDERGFCFVCRLRDL